MTVTPLRRTNKYGTAFANKMFEQARTALADHPEYTDREIRRVVNVLCRVEITSFLQMSQMSEVELYQYRGIGEHALQMLDDIAIGMHLRRRYTPEQRQNMIANAMSALAGWRS